MAKRVFAAHHQALEGRLARVDRVADALDDLARRAGLDGLAWAQAALPDQRYRIEVACATSSFSYVIDDEANNYTIAGILNAACLHWELDLARAIETWNDATASSLATTYAPRMVTT
jgi:hypothetical protein